MKLIYSVFVILALIGCSSSDDADRSRVCALPADTGPCRAAKPRYAYDPKHEDCGGFVYGGCQGNANNFNTWEECMQFCGNGPK